MKINRRVEVVVGDIRIKELFIQFHIDLSSNGVPAEGKITVYNLAEDTESRIYERGERLEIYAGFEGQEEEPPLLAKGDVRRLSRGREGTNRITDIEFGGSVEAITTAFINKTWGESEPVRNIVEFAVGEVEGVTLGSSFRLIPSGWSEKNFTWSGSLPSMLREILVRRGIEWYEQDGVIEFKGLDGTSVGSTIVLSPRTGMIGTPTVTDEGIEVQTVLDPRLRLDAKFQVEGLRILNLDSNPEWSVQTVRHRGDNRDGIYQSDVSGIDPNRQQENGS